ncbi:MAG TPA: LytTR family DNA-binding domain-containing protein [Cyclobacteriaceae bacterium]|nr:LytTR family DNA-binding domain-containing protein [Cyclobacteriaceae bacterium]
MKIRCLIVDDEPPALDVLRSHIANTPMLEVAGECHNAMGAFDFLQRQRVDLLFLDIQMPRLLGTDLLKALADPPKVIFTTAHREYAMDGFDLNAVDFLLKPISFDRFLKAVQKAVLPDMKGLKTEDHVNESPRFLYFRADRKMVKVLLNDISHVEGLKDYVKIHTGQQPLITKQTIMAVEEMLPADEFIRVHRSFIVSVRKITSYSPHAVFIGKEEVPIGPLYRNQVQKILTLK